MNYCIYFHRRPHDNTVFYVGVAKRSRKNFFRAREFRSEVRNPKWVSEFEKLEGKVTVEIVEYFETKEEAFDKEIYWINLFGRDSLTNISKGGVYSLEAKRVIQYSLQGELIKIWDSTSIASRELNIFHSLIYQTCNGKSGHAGNYIWRYYMPNFNMKIDPYIDPIAKEIHQFSLKGEYVRSFPSIQSVTKETGIDHGSVSNAAIGKRRSAGGFLWSFDKNILWVQKKHRYVLRMSMSGEILEKYNSLSEAARLMKLSTTTAIRNCFTGKQKQAYGFKWAILDGYSEYRNR